jgi:23S rRNA (uracil1939-C5)-methyltransferase
MPGDVVEVELLSQEKRYVEARVLRFVTRSSGREIPRCQVFEACGGCALQHLPYPTQWKLKFEGVQHVASRVGLESGSWEEFPAQNPWNYRNRIQLRSESGKLGFFRRGTREVIPTDRCEISHETLNQKMGELRQDFANEIQSDQMQKWELSVGAGGEVRVDRNQRHSAGGFRQVNEAQNERLRSWIQSCLVQADSKGVLYDLYGGDGNLARPVASRFHRVFCVDVSPIPQEPLPFEGWSWIRQPTEKWFPKIRPLREQELWVVCDPPREGLGRHGRQFERVARQLQVRGWIQVSCDPDAWARDVGSFTRAGWKLHRTAVFDFFPQTPHVETVSFLIRPYP